MSIRKRVWISGGQKKSAWVLVYTNAKGDRKQETFKTKREADQRWIQISGELSRGTHTSRSDSITVSDAGNIWIERAIFKGLEKSTYEEYRRVLRLHILPRLGHVRLAMLTRASVEAFKDGLLRDLSLKSASRAFGYFKIIMKLAEERELISTNVADKVTIEIQKRHRHRPQFFQKNEVNAALSASIALGPQHAAFSHLFWLHGLRASEGRGLPWKAIDFKFGRLVIFQRADRWRRIGPPKSEASFRTIPLTPSCLKALKAWKAECSPGPEDLVFPAKDGRPMSYYEQVRDLYDPIMFAAKLTKSVDGVETHSLSMHATRHTTASIWIEMGFSSKRVQTLMGHSSISVTFDLYGHLFELMETANDMMKAVDKWVSDEDDKRVDSADSDDVHNHSDGDGDEGSSNN